MGQLEEVLKIRDRYPDRLYTQIFYRITEPKVWDEIFKELDNQKYG